MRKWNTSDIREASFKAIYNGKETQEPKDTSYISDEEEANLMRKLQVCTSIFKGKLPFKFFSCGK